MLFRLWKAITCGRGHHRWVLWPTIPLDSPTDGTDSGFCVLVRICRRCDLTWEIE